MKITTCKDVYCANGGYCTDSEFGFQCVCRSDFGGKLCEHSIETIVARSKPSSPTDLTLFRFGKHVYRLVLVPRDFYTAKAICQQNGGYLACLSTLTEYEYIHELFSAISVFYDQAWVGFEWMFDGSCETSESGELMCPWRYRCIDKAVDDEGFDHWYNEKALETRYFRPIPHEPVDGWAITKGDAPLWELFHYDTKYPFICEYEEFCLSNFSCRNGGICSAEQQLHFTCNCSATAHTGTHCELPVCSSAYDQVCPCASNPCQNGGKCLQTSAGYTCDCHGTGFGGSTCSEDENECADPGLCNNHGFCSNTAGSYQCSCRSGYSGKHCEEGGAALSVSVQCEQRSLYLSTFLLVLGLFLGLMLCLCSLYFKRLRIKMKRVKSRKRHKATTTSTPAASVKELEATTVIIIIIAIIYSGDYYLWR